MAIPDAKKKPLCQKFIRQFWGPGVTATMNVWDLIAALVAVDEFFDKNGSDLTQNKSIQWNILQELPEPFATVATAEMKGWVGMAVMAHRSGVW